MAQGSPEAADWYWEDNRAASSIVVTQKSVWGGHIEGLSVGLKEVWPNCLTWEEEARFGSGWVLGGELLTWIVG